MSGFNIDTFKSTIGKKGLLRDNQFECVIQIPTFLQNTLGNFSHVKELRFWCESAEIPGVQLATHEIRRYGYGPFERKPYSANFTQSRVVLLGDAEGKNWDLFQKWIQYIHNFDFANKGANGGVGLGGSRIFETNYLHGSTGYTTSITITVYDNTGIERVKVKLIDAYPTFLDSIRLNWSNNNSIMRIPVTFTFFTWTNEITNLINQTP